MKKMSLFSLLFVSLFFVSSALAEGEANYYVRDIDNSTSITKDQAIVKIEGVEPDVQRTIMIKSVRTLFPSFERNNLFLQDLAVPAGTKLTIFRSVNGEAEYQPLEKFYRYDGGSNKLKKMRINNWYLPNRGPLIISPNEHRAVWFIESGRGYARFLQLFDFVKDTRKIIKILPVGQSFDYGDAVNLTYQHSVEWLDDCTIGYKTYSQTKKRTLDAAGDEAEKALLIKSEIIKLDGAKHLCF